MTIEAKISEAGTNGHGDKTATKPPISPLNGSKSAMVSEFYTVLADIEYLVKDVAQLTGDDLARTSVKIHEHIATARKAAEAMGDTLTDGAHQTAAATNDYVQAQPWKAIGIGTAIGFVLGAFLSRRA